MSPIVPEAVAAPGRPAEDGSALPWSESVSSASFSRSHFPEPTSSSPISRPSSTGWPSRWPAAVPKNAGSARPTSLYAPYRVKDPSFVVERIFESLRATGYEDASLFSLSVSDYPYLGRPSDR